MEEGWRTDLGGSFEVLDVVPIDIVMRSNRFSQFDSDDHSRAFRSRSTSKEHNSPTSVRERSLQRAP